MREGGNHFLERGTVLGGTISGIDGEQANKGFQVKFHALLWGCLAITLMCCLFKDDNDRTFKPILICLLFSPCYSSFILPLDSWILILPCLLII